MKCIKCGKELPGLLAYCDKCWDKYSDEKYKLIKMKEGTCIICGKEIEGLIFDLHGLDCEMHAYTDHPDDKYSHIEIPLKMKESEFTCIHCDRKVVIDRRLLELILRMTDTEEYLCECGADYFFRETEAWFWNIFKKADEDWLKERNDHWEKYYQEEDKNKKK